MENDILRKKWTFLPRRNQIVQNYRCILSFQHIFRGTEAKALWYMNDSYTIHKARMVVLCLPPGCAYFYKKANEKARGGREVEKHDKTEFILSHQFFIEFKATLNCAGLIMRAGLTHKVMLPLVCLSTTVLLQRVRVRQVATIKPNRKKRLQM